ncbi:MAG: S8 family serine peptidase [Actinomycetota bacterium]
MRSPTALSINRFRADPSTRSMCMMFPRLFLRLGCSLTLAAGGCLLLNSAATRVAASAPPRRYLVRLHAQAPAAPALQSLQGRFAFRARRVFRHALQGFSADLTAAQVASLRLDPRVADIQPDGPVSIAAQPRSARKVSAAMLKKLRRRQTVPTGIRRCGAHLSASANIDGVDDPLDLDIAVIDTGIDPRHPDLNVVTGLDLLPSGSGDPNGHGTHVAGIIGARDNGIGVVGVAPGARVWPIRVLNKRGVGYWADVVDGLDWVAERSTIIEVANLSLSGDSSADNSILRAAFDGLAAKGVTIVAAAGNADRSGPQEASRTVPARYASVIAVSALADSNGQAGASAGLFSVGRGYTEFDESFADFSNYGSAVSLIAPGVSILSTYKNRNYALISGTSQSTPHVSGAAALYRLTHPTATPAAVRAALLASGSSFVPYDYPDLHEPALNASGL